MVTLTLYAAGACLLAAAHVTSLPSGKPSHEVEKERPSFLSTLFSRHSASSKYNPLETELSTTKKNDHAHVRKQKTAIKPTLRTGESSGDLFKGMNTPKGRFEQVDLPKEIVAAPHEYHLVSPTPVQVTASSTAFAYNADHRRQVSAIYPVKVEQLHAARKIHGAGPTSTWGNAPFDTYTSKTQDLKNLHLKSHQIHQSNVERAESYPFSQKPHTEESDRMLRRKETSAAMLQLTDPKQAPLNGKEQNRAAQIDEHSHILLAAASDMGFKIVPKDANKEEGPKQA